MRLIPSQTDRPPGAAPLEAGAERTASVRPATYRRNTSPRRGLRQRGNEIIEFAVFACFLVPCLLWVFVNGMNLLRMIQCSQICRDIGNLYIHGVDYSTYSAQQTAARLAQGYGLQVASFTGNQATNSANGGNGYVVLSQIMYVGASTCSALPSGTTCTNQNKYVFLQQVTFGNSSARLGSTTVSSALGDPSGATVNTSGIVLDYLTNSAAVCSGCAGLWSTQLADGQAAYVAESFFVSADLGISAIPGGGIYSRVVM